MSFRLFGFPVRVGFWFFAIALYLGYLRVPAGTQGAPSLDAWWVMAIWLPIMFTGVLFHELGHAFAARWFGQEPSIELHGMGGFTAWSSLVPLSPLARVLVSLAGPLVGVGLGAAAMVALWWAPVAPGSLGEFALQSLIWVNLGWGVLNLIPILPLDGGQVLAAAMESVLGQGARRWAYLVSLFLGVGLVAATLAQNMFVATALLGLLVFQNYRGLQLERRLGADRPLVDFLRAAQAQLDSRNFQEAQQLAQVVAAQAKQPDVRRHAQHILAWAWLLDGNIEQAEEQTRVLSQQGEVEPALLGALRLALGRASQAIEPLEQALPHRPEFVAPRLVHAWIETAAFRRASELLSSAIGHMISHDAGRQLGVAAHDAGEFQAAGEIFERVFYRTGDGTDAFNVACAHSCLSDEEKAREWLNRARKAGFHEVSLLDADPDLAPLRATSWWSSFRSRFSGV